MGDAATSGDAVAAVSGVAVGACVPAVDDANRLLAVTVGAGVGLDSLRQAPPLDGCDVPSSVTTVTLVWPEHEPPDLLDPSSPSDTCTS